MTVIRVTDTSGRDTFYDEGVRVSVSNGLLWVYDKEDNVIAGHAVDQWSRWALLAKRA